MPSVGSVTTGRIDLAPQRLQDEADHANLGSVLQIDPDSQAAHGRRR